MKLDGYRAVGIKTGDKVLLRSRNKKDFNRRYPPVVNALNRLPDETVVDGEIVALDGAGRPSFNALQNEGSGGATIVYYVFDVLMLAGRDVMSEPLVTRRKLLCDEILPLVADPVRESPVLDATLADLIVAVRAQGLEGLVAKRLDSRYEPGERSGAWQKMRINRGQEFIIGGYTTGTRGFDALVFGYFDGDRLLYAGRTRAGFTPASREKLWRSFRGLDTAECPFVNLPEAHTGRWGQGLTAEKMKDCHWLRPVLVAQFEFVEWTPDGHLRHARFIGMREDKKAQDVRR
jgi:bifunctional non-homologous end joining protein LigD